MERMTREIPAITLRPVIIQQFTLRSPYQPKTLDEVHICQGKRGFCNSRDLCSQFHLLLFHILSWMQQHSKFYSWPRQDWRSNFQSLWKCATWHLLATTWTHVCERAPIFWASRHVLQCSWNVFSGTRCASRVDISTWALQCKHFFWSWDNQEGAL